MAKRVKIKEIIHSYLFHKNYSLAAKELGIDRKTVKRWVVRGTKLIGSRPSYKSLKRKSTKPKVIHRLLNSEIERSILKIRRETNFDVRKIKYELKRKSNIIVSPATIYRVIKRKDPNLIKEVRKYMRPKFQNGKSARPSNTIQPGYLQMDVKYVTPELSGLPYTAYEYGVIDVFSRFKMALILPVIDESGSILTMKYVLEKSPFKTVYVQTDNGWEFQRQFHKVCTDIGLTHYYIHKSSPNENAVIERSFRTDQEEFFFRLDKKVKDINELNMMFQKYLVWYNNDRIHMGLNYQTPIEVLSEYNLKLDVPNVMIH